MFFSSTATPLINHIKHNIPANFWYANSNNGFVQVAHARFVEVKINETRRNLCPGHITKHFVIWPDSDSGRVLHFTDRSEEFVQYGRQVMGVVGNLAEFEHFCHHFVVLTGPSLFIPSTKALLRRSTDRCLGKLGNPDDFTQVIAHARAVVTSSERDY